MLLPRTNQILKAAIEEFIRSGELVSSGKLYRRYNFGIKPAMIRMELERLTRDGYLEQPHHSSGRMPSDLGYELFIDEVMGKDNTVTDVSHRPSGKLARGGSKVVLKINRRRECDCAELVRCFERCAWDELLGTLADDLGALGVAREARTGTVVKEGLNCLIDHLEWETPKEIRDVIRDFVEIDNRLDELQNRLHRTGELKAFVGGKSPVTRSECLAVVEGEYKTNGGEVLLFLVGPKRMDYKKAVRIFRSFSNV